MATMFSLVDQGSMRFCLEASGDLCQFVPRMFLQPIAETPYFYRMFPSIHFIFYYTISL